MGATSLGWSTVLQMLILIFPVYLRQRPIHCQLPVAASAAMMHLQLSPVGVIPFPIAPLLINTNQRCHTNSSRVFFPPGTRWWGGIAQDHPHWLQLLPYIIVQDVGLNILCVVGCVC
jgi:hypothetical protein